MCDSCFLPGRAAGRAEGRQAGGPGLRGRGPELPRSPEKRLGSTGDRLPAENVSFWSSFLPGLGAGRRQRPEAGDGPLECVASARGHTRVTRPRDGTGWACSPACEVPFWLFY